MWFHHPFPRWRADDWLLYVPRTGASDGSDRWALKGSEGQTQPQIVIAMYYSQNQDVIHYVIHNQKSSQ